MGTHTPYMVNKAAELRTRAQQHKWSANFFVVCDSQHMTINKIPS